MSHVCQHGAVPCNTWILVRRSTSEALAEVGEDNPVLARINQARVEMLRPCQYLPRLSHREGAGPAGRCAVAEVLGEV